MAQGLNSEAMGQLQWGHGLLALCALLYLVWWVVFFRPDAGKVQGPLYWFGAGCLVIAAVAGIAGAILVALGASGLKAGLGLSGWWFALGAVAAYAAIACVTVRFWNRPVTTELLLFVAWAALELFVACALQVSGILDSSAMGWLIAVVVIVFALSLVCYVLYYRLTAMPSFVDGAIPLIAVGIFSIALFLLL